MHKILLSLGIGDWKGGHHGSYPKLVDWNLEDREYPIDLSEGWGHGLGGGRLSLASFINSDEFQSLKNGAANWAYEVIYTGLERELTVPEIGTALIEASNGHRVEIPEYLRSVLQRSLGYVNL